MEKKLFSDGYQSKPVYRTAYEIVKTTRAIVESMNESKDKWNLKTLMINNAMILPSKIAGAEAVEVFRIKMENAVLIKIAARELQSQVSLCRQLKLNTPQYLDILENEIHEFREHYNDWISNFDPSDDIDDGWNTFR